ncbi:glycosyltransferase family 2 protein [Bremerella sp.]|uniref:glycosyltransferase family 2 protein n=1 Tax=Bremerella sp. TaxID=2795602 RepID=UPI00391CFC6A
MVSSPSTGVQSESDHSQPVLTVIVPVFNEVGTINTLLERVLKAPFTKEVIVVDDGSTDGTTDVLSCWESEPEIKTLLHPENRGKGAAIRTALKVARGRFVIVQDADLEYDPDDYPRLVEPLLAGEADIVYGSRRSGAISGGPEWMNPFYHGVTSLNLLVRILYGVQLSDEATCYKAFPTGTLKSMQLTCERFEFCPEVTAKACCLKLRILEVGIHYHRRTSAEGKKIGLRDWFEAVATLWKLRNWKPPTDDTGGKLTADHDRVPETTAQLPGR